MKIAVIAQFNPNNKKGLTNYVLTKAKHMLALKEKGIETDFFIIQSLPTYFYSKFHHIKRELFKCEKDGYILVDGIKFKLLIIHHSAFHPLYESITKKTADYSWQLGKLAKLFKGYDAISSHWIIAHFLALKINEKYGIPYDTVWHGSDINIYAFGKPGRHAKIGDVFEHANMNFFVSKALAHRGDEVSPKGKKSHIYTGAANQFYKYSKEKKLELRWKYNVAGKKVVAYSGNLVSIKNPIVLPEIFRIIREHLSEKVVFWIIGDGPERIGLESKLELEGIDCRMFGDVLPNEMPDLMNCIDVLVAPSIQEGVSLVLQEVRSCGGYGVGSKVGGIPEVIGDDNVFPLDDYFVKNISERIVEIIKNDEQLEPLPVEYTWDAAIRKELEALCIYHGCNF